MLKNEIKLILLLWSVLLSGIVCSQENQQVRLSSLFPESLEFFSEDSTLTIPLINHSLANTKSSVYTEQDQSIMPHGYSALDWKLELLGDTGHRLSLNLKRFKNSNYTEIPNDQLSRSLQIYSLKQEALTRVLTVHSKINSVARWLFSSFVDSKFQEARKLAWSNNYDQLLLPGLTPASFTSWELDFNKLSLVSRQVVELEIPILQVIINSSRVSECQQYQFIQRKQPLAKLVKRSVERLSFLSINQESSERVVIYRDQISQQVIATFRYDLDNKPILAMLSVLSSENLPILNYLLKNQRKWEAVLREAKFCPSSLQEYQALDPNLLIK